MSILAVEQLGLGVGGRTFCDGLSQGFGAGQVWGVLGANGSGKTTLLHTLAGLRAPQQGRVLLDATPLQSLAVRQRAQRIGVLLQEGDHAFPASVRECAMLGRHPHLEPWEWERPEDWARVDQALAAVGLDHLAAQDQGALSGGERQRLKLATLMVQAPAIWLLDEPTNHLDLHHQVSLLDTLCAQIRGRGELLVMSLHDLNLAARFCDHLVLMYGDGRVEAGRADALLEPDRLSALYAHPIRRCRDGERLLFVPD